MLREALSWSLCSKVVAKETGSSRWNLKVPTTCPSSLSRRTSTVNSRGKGDFPLVLAAATEKVAEIGAGARWLGHDGQVDGGRGFVERNTGNTFTVDLDACVEARLLRECEHLRYRAVRHADECGGSILFDEAIESLASGITYSD